MNKVNENKVSNIKIIKHFIKDLSFENLHKVNHDPINNKNSNIDLNMKAIYQPFNNDFFGLVLNYTFDCSSKESKEKLSHLELDYFGFFKILDPSNINQKNLTQNGLKLIYPFAKEIVENITQKGGSVPIILNEIDFNILEI